jgi:outer membrane protein insertion porin family
MLVGVLLVLVPSTSSAQAADAGAPATVAAPAKDAGAPKSGPASLDGGAPKATDAGAAPKGDAAPMVPDATDGGAPAASAGPGADGGAPPGSAASGGPAAPTPRAAASEGPAIRLPLTEAEKASGAPIVAIEVSGNRRVARDDVLTYLRLKSGQTFRAELLASDVRALWDSGFFDDIEVDLTSSDRGVALRFLVRERPNVKAVEFEGNSEIENDKLQEAIEVKANTILSVPAVRRSVQKIKDAYAEKGYFLADVESSVDAEKDNEVVVRFKIAEHQPVTVRRVTFIGNYNVPTPSCARACRRATPASSRSARAVPIAKTSSSATCSC